MGLEINSQRTADEPRSRDEVIRAQPRADKLRRKDTPLAASDSFQNLKNTGTALRGTTLENARNLVDRPIQGRVVDRGPLGAERALVNTGRRSSTNPPPNDDITFIGMNDGGRGEADRLRKKSGKKVTHIGSTKEQDVIERNGKRYDLKTRQGIDDFTRTFGLPEEQRKKVADAIEKQGERGRDELAQLAEQWAIAERGGSIPSRLVISGHSNGGGVWGDNNGTLKLDALKDLAKAMPKAAGQIRHVHMAACYTGGRRGLDGLRDTFPNAKTIFAYGQTAPGSDSGADTHLARWEKATRGDPDNLDPAIVRGTRKGENVDTWSARDGHKMTDSGPLEDARRRYLASRETAEQYLNGEQEVTSTQSGPLREHYNNIQRMLGNGALPEEERKALEKERDKIIRLLYYSKTVTKQFQSKYQQQLTDGYRALGMEPPDFSKLTRKQALEKIAELERAVNEGSPEAAKQALALLRGLRDLDSSVIPDGWVGAQLEIHFGGINNRPPGGRR